MMHIAIADASDFSTLTWGSSLLLVVILITIVIKLPVACSHWATRFLGVTLCVCGGIGCGSDGSNTQRGTWAAPPPVSVPPLPPPRDYSSYPVDAKGRPILAQGPRVSLLVNTTPDAISARERCADLVANCLRPGERSLDACMMSAPRCQTQTPWTEDAPCCADACASAYAGQRKTRVDPITAYLSVLYDPPTCMPGVGAMLGGE